MDAGRAVHHQHHLSSHVWLIGFPRVRESLVQAEGTRAQTVGLSVPRSGLADILLHSNNATDTILPAPASPDRSRVACQIPTALEAPIGLLREPVH